MAIRAVMSGKWLPAISLVAAFALGVAAQRGGLIDAIAKYRGDIAFLSQQHMKLVAISGPLGRTIATRSERPMPSLLRVPLVSVTSWRSAA